MNHLGHRLIICLSFAAILAAEMTPADTFETNINIAFSTAEKGLSQAALIFTTNNIGQTATLTGTNGTGSYLCLVQSMSPSGTLLPANGYIYISPNTSGCNFRVTLPSGLILDKTIFTTNWSGYTGPALLVQSSGTGILYQFLTYGEHYTLGDNAPFSILSDQMNVNIYNSSYENTGISTGFWFCILSADNANLSTNESSPVEGYSMLSIGTVGEHTKVQIHEEAEYGSWADYAMWMNYCNGIQFTTGERFYGPVFSNERLTISGSPEFFSTVSSHATNFSGSTNACIFHAAVTLGAPTQTMQVINFSNLAAKATLILTGQTTIAMSKTNMLITNSRKAWTNRVVGCSSNGLIYVRAATTGSVMTNADIYVGGTGTLNGRITLVADRDIYITNHLYYASDPKTNPLSDDALGLIAKRDIGIATNWPSNLTIYAHMIATGLYDTNTRYDGSFGVINWTNAPARGRLTVHGGIVQDNRAVVSQLSGTNVIHGYTKDYTFDTRFTNDPPPGYPRQPWSPRHTENRSTNCWLEMDIEGSGVVSTLDGWYSATTTLVVTADAATNWFLESWQGDTNDCTLSSNAIITSMNKPRSISAKFVPDTNAPHGTPHSWLHGYGLTNFSLDVEEMKDADGDGLLNWQEWFAGTDPTELASSLRMATPEPTPDGMLIQWPAVPGKGYSIFRSSNLVDDPFIYAVATNILATNVVLEFEDTNFSSTAPTFWRVRVE